MAYNLVYNNDKVWVSKKI